MQNSELCFFNNLCNLIAHDAPTKKLFCIFRKNKSKSILVVSDVYNKWEGIYVILFIYNMRSNFC